MNVPNAASIKSGLKVAKTFLRDNSHSIKTVVAMIGCLWACKEFYETFPKAQELKEKARNEKGKELTKLETIVAVAPAFTEPGAILLLTEWFIFWAHKDAAGKILVASAVAKYYAEKDEKFREKAEEILGEKKVKSIHEAISQEEVNNTDPMIFDSIPKDEDGKYWIMETGSGNWYRGTREETDHNLAVLAASVAAGDEVPYSDFLCSMGLVTTTLAAETFIFDERKKSSMLHTGSLWDYCQGPDGRPAAIIRTGDILTTFLR